MRSLKEINFEKLLKIKAIITDVDGVLTDGSISLYYKWRTIVTF